MILEYNDVQQEYISTGHIYNLTTHRYPRTTIADVKWVLMSSTEGNFVLHFVKFSITFGVSLIFGHGSSFSHLSYLAKISSRDVKVSNEARFLIQSSSMWLWFNAKSDENTEEQQFIEENVQLFFSIHPILDGIFLQVKRNIEGI